MRDIGLEHVSQAETAKRWKVRSLESKRDNRYRWILGMHPRHLAQRKQEQVSPALVF